MRRPAFLLAPILLALSITLPIAHPARAAQSGRDEHETLPIVDTHIHYNRDVWSVYSVDEALAILDQAGVARAFVSSTPDDGSLLLHERAPDRIVLDLRPYRITADQATWTRDPTIVPYLEERLAERAYRGIGEFHLLDGDTDRADVPRQLAALAAQRGLILHAHADATALEQLLDVRPDITVLWAHAGMTATPGTVQRLLTLHPNLFVELALREDIAPNGQLDPDWAALFAQFPERFMIGTDTWIPSQWTNLPTLMARVRTWLRQLPTDLAENVAWRNADRLLRSP